MIDATDRTELSARQFLSPTPPQFYYPPAFCKDGPPEVILNVRLTKDLPDSSYQAAQC